MQNKVLADLFMIAGLFVVSIPMWAHHGALRWDTKQSATISGQVREFDWQNPHPLLLLDVKNDKGIIETWAIEFHPPNAMARALGWNRNTFKAGDQITIYGNPERSGQPLSNGFKSLRPVKVTFSGDREAIVDPPGGR